MIREGLAVIDLDEMKKIIRCEDIVAGLAYAVDEILEDMPQAILMAEKTYKKCHRHYESHEDIAAIQRAEIEIMMEAESEGRRIFFLIPDWLLNTDWLDDVIYYDSVRVTGPHETQLRFCFTSWEWNHLIPMFLDSCVAVVYRAHRKPWMT